MKAMYAPLITCITVMSQQNYILISQTPIISHPARHSRTHITKNDKLVVIFSNKFPVGGLQLLQIC